MNAWHIVGLLICFPGAYVMVYVSEALGHSWKDPVLPPLTYAIGLTVMATGAFIK